LTEVALQQGIAANTRGQLDAGAAYLKNALETARLAGNLQQEINATLRLSTNAYQSGDAAAAERYAREALDTARSHQLEALAIRGLVNLGNAFRRKQDFPHTEQYYLEALNLARQTRSGPLTALSLSSLAALHDQTQKPGKSLVEAQEALAFYQANHYAKQSLQCLGIIARAKAAGDDYDGALASFHSLLESAEKEQDRSQMASAHEGIGANLFRQDRFPEALEEYRKSLELAADVEHIGYAGLQCGDTLWRLGRYPEAAAMFAKADAVAQKFPPLRLGLQYARAGMLLSQGRFQEAADLARAGLAADAAKTPDLDAKIEQVFGLALMDEGNKTEGVKECERARAAAEAGGDMSDILDAEAAALQARLSNGDRKSALELIQQIEPRLAARPELRWRVLALASRADAQYAARAREALLQLSHQWRSSAYNEYLTRPDIGKLSRPLLQAVSAIH
jgi:tetratricopeptide (TPR) repeat protein